MSKNRRRFRADYKFRVALEAAKGQETLSELATKYGLHPNQISQWKRQLLDSGAEVFSHNGNKEAQGQDAQQSEPVSYTHLRAHETPEHLVCRLLLEKKN